MEDSLRPLTTTDNASLQPNDVTEQEKQAILKRIVRHGISHLEKQLVAGRADPSHALGTALQAEQLELKNELTRQRLEKQSAFLTVEAAQEAARTFVDGFKEAIIEVAGNLGLDGEAFWLQVCERRSQIQTETILKLARERATRRLDKENDI